MLPKDREIQLPVQNPRFFCNVGHPTLAYRPRISDKHLVNFDGLSYLILAKFDGHFLLYPSGPV